MNLPRLASVAIATLLLGGCAATGGAPGTPAPAPPSTSPSTSPSKSPSTSPTTSPTTSPSSAPPSTGADLPAPASTADAGSAGAAAARTPGEKRAEIDGQLTASLGKFDEQLRREQQRNAAERDTRTASRADGTAVDGVASGRDAAGELARDRTGDLRSEGSTTTARNGNADPAASGQGAGASNGGGGASVKPIPSGEDDDIIARRLRKAAEAETDPELKEKLWKEYRDYKENTGGRS